MKIIRSLEVCDTRAIRLVMVAAGLTLVAAILATNVASFLLGLAAIMGCGTILERNYQRGAYAEVARDDRSRRRISSRR